MAAMETTTTSNSAELLFLGSRCRVLADSESTDGLYGLVDMIEVPAGDMPPLHVHRAEDGRVCARAARRSPHLPGWRRPGSLPRGVSALRVRGVREGCRRAR